MTLIHGDSLEELKKLQENSVDAVVTDPPYGIGFMGKEWDNFKPRSVKKTTKLVYKTDYINGVPVKRKTPELVTRDSGARVSGTYDLSLTGNQKFQEWTNQWATECFRILKPGGYLLSFAGTRTYHRMATGIEDAGFEIRDMIAWVYGSGFPKSLNIGKEVDKLQGNEREVLPPKQFADGTRQRATARAGIYSEQKGQAKNTKGTSEWEGWGTALKPALEPITVARKPLAEKTVAENCLKWGVGGINIDECRVGTEEIEKGKGNRTLPQFSGKYNNGETYEGHNAENGTNQGRFPANLIHDGSDEVVELFPNTKQPSFRNGDRVSNNDGIVPWNRGRATGREVRGAGFTDTGSAARFFYCAKASKSERNLGCEGLEKKSGSEKTGRKPNSPGLVGNKELGYNSNPYANGTPSKNHHPTVKPIALMEYLVRLVSREGSTVLDPFMGSGTTGIACKKLKRHFIGIEREAEYIKIAESRIAAQPTPLL